MKRVLAMDANKQKALDAVLGQIERQFGKGAIMKMGEQHREAIPAVSTGSLGLDIALVIGGLPMCRIVKIYGTDSSSNTTKSLSVMAQAHKMRQTVANIDDEHALDPLYAEKLGIDLNIMLVSQPDAGQQAL